MTDAPLDAHTAELLRGFDPSDEVVSAHRAASEALRQWSLGSPPLLRGRLVIADSRLHAEQQALANLAMPQRSALQCSWRTTATTQ